MPRPAGVNLVNVEAVRKGFGTRTLLDSVSLGVAAGERIGVVGRNGDGKTTLLSVLAGRELPDAGRVTHVGGLRLAFLGQGDAVDSKVTAGAWVTRERPAHEWAADPRVREVLTGLLGGLDLAGLPEGPRSRAASLSGGERRRVGLARALLEPADLIVLDEPTNHLDVEAIDWLAGHLAAQPAAVVVVTHDRWFLDAVCSRTWEVADGRVHQYDGGYAAYVLARAERQRVAAVDESRRANLLRKELAWLRRGPPARTAKPKFRIDAATALLGAEPSPRDSVELLRFASARLGRTVYELEDVTARAGDAALLDAVTWHLGPGDRIGVVGINGSGKTTLLRLLTGAVRPVSGRVVRGQTVRAAYLSQTVTELPAGLRVLESVEQVRRMVDLGGGRTLSASQLCERFGFAGNRQWTPVEELSGGERRRLQLLRLLMEEPNVLLLDEPTNDLDIETLTAVEDLLDGWPGSLVVVTHDRYFLERTCDRVLALFGDGRLTDLPGGVDDYLARRRTAAAAPIAPGSRAAASGAVDTTGTPGATAGDVRQAKKELVRLERQLERLAGRERSLHESMAEHAADYEKVATLDTQLRELRSEQAELEERWLLLADEVSG